MKEKRRKKDRKKKEEREEGKKEKRQSKGHLKIITSGQKLHFVAYVIAVGLGRCWTTSMSHD